jgi:hypothetical protein
MRFLPFLATLLGTACLSLPVAAQDGHTVWRLFVGDHAAPRVTAIDAGSGEIISRFDLSSPATLYATASQRGVYAVQGGANTISAIASGIERSDHGDHADLEVSAPALVDLTVDGDRPVHFVEHHGRIALFFDGEGVARLVDESDWLDGDTSLAISEINTGKPHHGVVIPWGDHALATEATPDADTTRPHGLYVADRSGNRVGDLQPCPALHGEASSGNITAIACAHGIVFATGSGIPVLSHVAYPAHLPEGSSSTLLGCVGLQYFLGNFGADRVVIIDPSDDQGFRLVDLPLRRVHFAVDPTNARFAYILTEDGTLHRLDVVSGKLTDAIAVTAPYSMDGPWDLPRPRIAVAGSEIMVTDPQAGVIRVVDGASFTVSRDIAVEGVPFTIVAVGGSGAAH